jgi:hypothetical protein
VSIISREGHKRRAVTVISCLEITWKMFEDKTRVPMADCYKPPLPLQALSAVETARALVVARLETAYAARGFEPPFATWPFVDSAFESALGLSPRELLKLCDRHQQNCIAAGEVTLCKSFDSTQPPPREGETAGLDQVYQSELKAAVIANLIDTEGEDQFRELIDGTLRLLEKHYGLPDDIDSEVHRDLTKSALRCMAACPSPFLASPVASSTIVSASSDIQMRRPFKRA